MKIEKLTLDKNKSEINLKFYFFLKFITKLKPSERQINLIIEKINLQKNDLNYLHQINERLFDKSLNKIEIIREINLKINNEQDLELFAYSLSLTQVKELLLAEAKIFETIDLKNLVNLDPLSLWYDQISVFKPYKTRVSGALLSLLFFEKLESSQLNFVSQDSIDFIKDLSRKTKIFKNRGLESNQIFMLSFSESINQSIISDSGSNYEDRIRSVLNKIGIKNIIKTHDKIDKSTEYDFFFKIDNKSYGIGAKRTLRERYKQFIKTSLTNKIDVSIQITIGVDLNEEKAKTIINHGSYIFVADEIYQTREFLQNLRQVFSVKSLNLQTLKNL